MRRLLCALVALTIAAPADAARVVIWKAGGNGAAGPDGVEKMLSAVTDVATALGIDYDILPQSVAAVRPDCLRTLTVTFPDSSTRTYGGQVFLHWRVSAPVTERAAGFDPDAITKGAAWPAGPTAYFGMTNIPGGTIYSSNSACSTAVTPGTSLTFFANGGVFEAAQYMVGKPYVWKGSTNPYYWRTSSALTITRAALGAGLTDPGVVRPRVSIASSSVSYRTNGLSSCTDCDSIPRGATFADSRADTAVIWTRERAYTSTTARDPAPLVFAPMLYPSNGGPDLPGTGIAQVFAIMDSAAGGTLIGQKPRWQPIKSAIGIAEAFTRSVSIGGGGVDIHGLKCPSGGLCDSTYNKAGIDSLNSLNVPYTVFVNTDSLESYPYEKRWWAAGSNVEFSPEPRTILGTTVAVNAGNASRFLNIDPFGAKRVRVPISGDRYANGGACNGTDTTTSCLLSYARARLDSVPEFRGRMSNAILAPQYDYISSNFTRANLPGADSNSVEAAMWRAGYRVAITSILALNSNPSASWALDGNGNPVLPTDAGNTGVKAMRAGDYTHDIRSGPNGSGAVLGKFKWVSARLFDEDALFQYAGHSHTAVGEAMNGVLLNDWYPTQLAVRPYYYHAFKSRMSVHLFRMGDLGFQRNATDNPVRPGWYAIKHYVNTIRSINEFAGRTVWQIVQVDDL